MENKKCLIKFESQVSLAILSGWSVESKKDLTKFEAQIS